MKRTDLIVENAVINDKTNNVNVHRYTYHGTEIIETDITDASLSQCGRYVTIFTDKGDVYSCLYHVLSGFISSGKALVVGLGNERISSDSLGVKALRYIPATAHLSSCVEFGELEMREVCVIEAGVTGKTGIESAGRIACIAEYAGADIIVAIDSLACADTERLCRTIQITDSGISPGSGVGNNRNALNSDTCGIPVVAIGVPTVIDLESIAENKTKGLMVSPRNIDVLTDDFARIIGKTVSKVLNPSLTEEEIQALIID